MRSETILVLKASKVQRTAGLLGGIRDLSLIPCGKGKSLLLFFTKQINFLPFFINFIKFIFSKHGYILFIYIETCIFI